ncbi:T9SS type A sorting domain-containing protein [Brumimicrobium aurantiacum]|uniref:T9SS type A sorting domain-containing protein n=1 Tax=Brumimicrobium aurantiacum TaxID=1737063 RepID=UPI001403F8CE|nr:T9SS type A sorting domain-containing protein [Brumimicrobium aurantiacum]
MKKHLLLGVAMLFAISMNAQVVFLGLSPASVEGGYDMTYGTPSSGWGSADLMDPMNAVTGDLVAYETDSTACSAPTNAAAIAGNIAVVYRADCEFGTKAQNAEAAGAIAVVIINNVPGAPISMGAGAAGATVTIPVVMLTDVDGAFFAGEMDNGTVNVFLGNKTGYFNDDLGIKESQILRPQYSSIPSAIATDASEYQINLAAYAFNYGANDQTDVALNAVIEFNGTEVYNETSATASIASGDSLLFNLPDFTPTAAWDEGYYSLTYTVESSATDEYVVDDVLESDFVISPSKLSYAKFDEATMMPGETTGLRPVDANGVAIPDYTSCITFMDENASRLAPKSISFSSSKASDAIDPSLVGEEVRVEIYKYNDNFVDINDAGYQNPISLFSLIMDSEYQYSSDVPNEMVTAEFENSEIVALEDNQRYLFCVNTFNEEVYFGHDSNRDYIFNLDYYLQPMFPVGSNGSYNPNGFGAETVAAVTVDFIDAAQVNLENEKSAIKMNAYPSPASDVLNIDFNKNEVNKVEVINMMGQTVVAQDVKVNAETAKVNVANVENGVYIVKVHLTNNLTHTMQVVVNH